VIEKVHREGIRFIARFDFSKVNENIAQQNPEWMYKSVRGELVNYNGQVHTCVNGYYQQECSLKILEEVIRNYPIDAVFFNMIGYHTHDYSGNYHGICQCDNCRERFRNFYGHELPLKESSEDEVYRKYFRFKEDTCKELYTKITGYIKALNPDIAICNYTHEGTDIYRKESNTGLDRELPEWNYSASDNVKTVMGSWENMAVSNATVHFIDYPYRHSGVSSNLTALRLAQDLANGGWLDYFVIGHLGNQDDRVCLNLVRELFSFHKQYEDYFKHTSSVADVCLIVPESSSYFGSIKEYRGIFRILSEQHILFDAIHDSVLDTPQAAEKIRKYGIVILPDTRNMSDHAVKVLDAYVREGGKILMTGAPSLCDLKGSTFENIRLECAGVAEIKQCIKKTRGTYLRVRNFDKETLNGFDQIDIIYLDEDFKECRLSDSATGYLGYIPACMFGPPEKCYYTAETDIPGLILNRYGAGVCAYIPWSLGRHYQKLSNHAHTTLLTRVLEDLLELKRSVVVKTSPLVEVISRIQKDGKWQLINLVNLSGQLGTAFLEPLPVNDIQISVPQARKPVKVVALRSGRTLKYTYSEDKTLHFTLERLELLEIVVLLYE
ncbi:MAG: family 10 glycosylhydrolase, partial [Chitinophagaceae bacterium]|nr:family 10 glycosylhydrolase [Chitinophagaceae bacterium]